MLSGSLSFFSIPALLLAGMATLTWDTHSGNIPGEYLPSGEEKLPAAHEPPGLPYYFCFKQPASITCDWVLGL